MYSGPALYQGKVGSTGTSTGPHAHFRLTKDGKEIPFSTARSDIGQYLQFRLPGKEDWQSFYTKGVSGYLLNPAAPLTSPYGMRKHPVHGDMRHHGGEDYGLPEGTQLRFLGQGSVATHANQGGAGNVSSLRTGPYELQTFHLSELPAAATTRKSDATATTSAPDSEAWAQAYVQNQIENQTQQGKLIDALINVIGEKEKPKSLMEQMKEGLIGNALQQALTPKNFLSQFTGSDPYLQGQQYATSQFFGL